VYEGLDRAVRTEAARLVLAGFGPPELLPGVGPWAAAAGKFDEARRAAGNTWLARAPPTTGTRSGRGTGALEQAEQLRADAAVWYVLAMTHWQRGDKERANRYYHLARRWMKQNKSRSGNC